MTLYDFERYDIISGIMVMWIMHLIKFDYCYTTPTLVKHCPHEEKTNKTFSLLFTQLDAHVGYIVEFSTNME